MQRITNTMLYGNGDGTYGHGDYIDYRLTIGERGGVVVERG